jgi:hypothetical protein
MRSRSTAVDGVKKTYADYLKLPPWPVPALMSVAYAFEHQLAARGSLKTGSSLFAVAIRNP